MDVNIVAYNNLNSSKYCIIKISLPHLYYNAKEMSNLLQDNRVMKKLEVNCE